MSAIVRQMVTSGTRSTTKEVPQVAAEMDLLGDRTLEAAPRSKTNSVDD
jgi:hypothetical protein